MTDLPWPGHASLARAPPPQTGHADPRMLLDPRGARIVLGAALPVDAPAVPIGASAHSLFGPRGLCLVAPEGPLIVADTGHHRLLVWTRVPAADHMPADIVVGQPDFCGDGRNANGAIGAATLNVPTGVAFGNDAVAVADAWNHRVLLWFGVPRRCNQPADVVVGQADFQSGAANRGQPSARADTLNWCYGVTIDAGRLIVADTGNRRVLIWNTIPSRNNTPADLVLGQRDFEQRDDNAGGCIAGAGMRWPHGVIAQAGRLFVADAGNSRIMGWQSPPGENGAPCDFVLGQTDVEGIDRNQGRDDPSAATLNMPYGVTLHDRTVIVADTANSRLLGYPVGQLESGTKASFLAGQFRFDQNGENWWQPPTRDSLCWPFAAAASGNTLAVADSGNNRVLLWDIV